MPSDITARDESGDCIPRWAVTVGHTSRAWRLAARVFCSARRQRTDDTSGPDVNTSDVPQPVRKRVLREYHAFNLAQARQGAEELVHAGFNTGSVPYGYRALRVQVTPAARRPRWRTRLVIEPVEAATVKMIFAWRVEDGLTVTGIRHRLVAARYPAPLDPETGQPGLWTRTAVRAILRFSAPNRSRLSLVGGV
jgi:hypothetical protein